ncbi:MAG: DUF47 domain-containing protein [Sphaerochaetaceae bacterium]
MKFGKNKDINYFQLLSEMMDCSLRTATELDSLFNNYTEVETRAENIHRIEHEGDEMLHNLVRELNKAFITPIDREDLLKLGSQIDSVTDAIEDVALTLDMLSVKAVRNEILPVSALMVQACSTLVKAFDEFEHFKTSHELTQMLISVNHDEESADRFYRANVKALYCDETIAPINVIRWKEIFDGMELVLDTCEDVADVLEAMAVKNR